MWGAEVEVDADADAVVVGRWRHELVARLNRFGGSNAELVSLIAALEELKSAACALQAEAAVAVDRAERDRQARAGVPARRRGLGVAAQVGLARRESPHRGTALLGAARVWLTEMPHTFRALREGHLSEHRAMLLVQETACLDVEDRREVDALLCGDPSTLEGIGTRQLVAAARGHAARLDPAAVVRRARRAESERRVTLRPAPDTMTYLTALLPVAQGVAVYAALCRAADAAAATPAGAASAMSGGTAAATPDCAVTPTPAGAASARPGSAPAVTPAGDLVRARRSRGQVMADTLVELVTGQSIASAVPVTVNLVLSDSALLGADHQPGHVTGGGSVPAQIARELAAAGIDADAAWLRRLYADPSGDLVAMTSRARFHPDGLAEFLRIRDQGICRTPYCGAPVRHIDHIVPVAAGGQTTAENGEGLCVACNLAKEAPGWSRRLVPRAGPGHEVLTTTPTGHRYRSRAPSLPAPAAVAAPEPARVDSSAPGGVASPVRAGVSAPESAGVADPRPAGVAAEEGGMRTTAGMDSVIDVCFRLLAVEYAELAA